MVQKSALLAALVLPSIGLRMAQFQTGNGITLCRACHSELHKGFNSRPDISLPIDAQGGEKLGSMERLFSILTDDAIERELHSEEFYFVSDELLTLLKGWQGYPENAHFPGGRLEQAYLILAEPELGARRALAATYGFQFPDRPLLPGGALLFHGNANKEPSDCAVFRPYVSRTRL